MSSVAKNSGNMEKKSHFELSTTRIEAFSDGVFAIAITLLVLEIKVPHLSDLSGKMTLLQALRAQWPAYVAYVLSFVTILIMWMNHHKLFRQIHLLRSAAQHTW